MTDLAPPAFGDADFQPVYDQRGKLKWFRLDILSHQLIPYVNQLCEIGECTFIRVRSTYAAVNGESDNADSNLKTFYWKYACSYGPERVRKTRTVAAEGTAKAKPSACRMSRALTSQFCCLAGQARRIFQMIKRKNLVAKRCRCPIVQVGYGPRSAARMLCLAVAGYLRTSFSAEPCLSFSC